MPPQTAYKLIQSLFCQSLSFSLLYTITGVCVCVCVCAVADELREEIRKFKDYRSNGITTIQGHTHTHTHIVGQIWALMRGETSLTKMNILYNFQELNYVIV